MTMASNEIGSQKQESQVLDRGTKTKSDCVKEDRIRKELYKMEMKTKENWVQKWGFLMEYRKFQGEKKTEKYHPSNKFEETPKNHLEADKASNPQNFIVQRYPTLSSGMIGWLSAFAENNLDKVSGSTYVSRKQTMNPPKTSDEPDLKHQRFIILG